jgi:predicted membrane protein
MHITITEGAALELHVSGGVGDTVIDVPSGAALSLDASTGLGAVNVPSDYQRVSGDDDDGVWESSNFDESQRQIVIHYDGGVGGLTIR